jgi:hypothetical protein
LERWQGGIWGRQKTWRQKTEEKEKRGTLNIEHPTLNIEVGRE